MTETTTPEITAPGVGAQLSQARQAQGLSLGEMARQLKLSVKQVDALERDDYSNFPGALWARGFLRNYARSLGLDADALIEKSGLAGEVPGSIIPGAGTPLPADTTRERRRTVYLVIVFVVLGLFVLGLLGQRASKDRSHASAPVTSPATSPAVPASSPAPETPAPPPPAPVAATPPVGGEMPTASTQVTAPEVPKAPSAASVTTPANPVPPEIPQTGGAAQSAPAPPVVSSAAPAAPATTEAAAPAAPKPRTLRFTFTQSVEVEVTDANGVVLLANLQAAGTEKAVRGMPPFSISVGNVHAVRLVYRGREIDLMSRGWNGVAKFSLK
ncbi:MAG: helix-turn-helix domain-containing protein [Betaproteobacteria bacterium]|nr:helix-turn-helix domain-containing protein [Betaproteobacteria bacterium]